MQGPVPCFIAPTKVPGEGKQSASWMQAPKAWNGASAVISQGIILLNSCDYREIYMYPPHNYNNCESSAYVYAHVKCLMIRHDHLSGYPMYWAGALGSYSQGSVDPFQSPTGRLTMKQLCEKKFCTHPHRKQNHEQLLCSILFSHHPLNPVEVKNTKVHYKT